jgi:phosphate transport system substrate-binding protein
VPEGPKDGVVAPAGEPLGLRGLWLFVGLVLLGLAGASIAVLGGLGQGDTPPFLNRSVPHRRTQALASARGELHLAGSGTNVGLTRRLADAFRATHPDRHIVVHESIGSEGGIRAVSDGAISLGLISRPLSLQERQLSLQVVPYARVAVVIAGHPGVRAQSLTRQDLLALYRGARPRWPTGEPVRVIQRERGDSANRAVGSVLPSFAAVDQSARRARRWRVVYADTAMREALLATPGGVGLFDLGAILSERLPLQVISYEGRRPSAADPLPKGYPFHKDLAFVWGPHQTPLVSAFLKFVASAAGGAVIRRHGYRPLSGAPP